MNELSTKPHYERAFYRVLYTARIFEFTRRLYPFLGRRIFNAVAMTVAYGYAVTQPGVRDVVRRNLRLLTGRPVSRRSGTRVFLNYARAISDYVCVGGMDRRAALRLCSEQLGIENLKRASEHDKGAVLATGHFGFFEFGALLLGEMGYPVTVLTDSEPQPELTEWRARFRRGWGADTLEVGSDSFASLEVVKALNRGRFCAMLADRPLHGPSIRTDLPGGAVPFSTSPALLAYLADCPIIPVAVNHIAGKRRYRMTAKACIWIDRSLPRNESIEKATRELAASLFEEISQTPEQWYQFVPVS